MSRMIFNEVLNEIERLGTLIVSASDRDPIGPGFEPRLVLASSAPNGFIKELSVQYESCSAPKRSSRALREE